MRTPEDLILVKVTLSALVSLDLERIIEDPRWATVADNVDLNDPEQREQALFQYLGSYIGREREQLFDTVFMPATNGPADLTVEKMENVSHGTHTSSSGNSAGN